MGNKVDALQARMKSARQSGGKSMWYMLFANAVADRLCETETVTRAEMREIFAKRLTEVQSTPEAAILVPAYDECLQRLDEFQSAKVADNGYSPTGLQG